MNVTLRPPPMTREQFLDWAARQETPFEFDGSKPVAMTGGNIRHAQICSNLIYELRRRLEGSSALVLPEAGVASSFGSVRYPDVLVTLTAVPGSDRIIPEPLIVFEVVSPTSGRTDRTIKLREYRAVNSIRRYVIVDGSGPDIDVFSRGGAGEDWVPESLTSGENLALPEAGIEVPVDEIFRGIVFDEPTASEPVA